MIITKYAMKFKTTVYVLILGIFILGLGAYNRLPLEDAPEIEIPWILVHTVYPGVAPEDMERLVTNVIEGDLKEIQDVKEITSTSQESVSLITMEFISDIDTDDAYQSVRDKVDSAKVDLPDDAEEPQIIEINTTDFPIIQVIVSADYGMAKLKTIAENLEESMEQINGVLGVDLIGGLDREIYVYLDPERLEYYKIGVEQVIGRIQQEHRTTPAGNLDLGNSKYSVRIPGEYKDVSLMEDIVIKAPQGKPIKIRDIGRVVDGFKDRETISRLNNVECVALRVRKQSGENIVRIADDIKALLATQQPLLPQGTNLRIVQDSSDMIRDQVDNVENSIISGLLMVMLVLWVALGPRNSSFVALAIPLSMLITFIALEFMGVTLNIVVLFSLILALGMLVDNSIVVIENIYRHASMGKSLAKSAYDATAEVSWPIIASTATTVAAFWPLLYMPGIAGDFMYYMPLTVITALLATLFVALVVNPVVAGDFLKPSSEVLFDTSGEAKTPVLKRYQSILNWSLDHPFLLMALSFVVLIMSFALFGRFNAGVNFMPDTPPLRGQVIFEGPQGMTLERTDQVIKQVEKIALSEDNSESVIGNSGFSGGDGMGSSGSGGTQNGVVDLEFLDRKERTHSTWDTIDSIRSNLKGLVGGKLKVKLEDKGPPTGDPISVEIAGPDYDVVNEYAEKCLPLVASVEGAIELETDFEGSKPEIRIDVNREKAMQRKVNSAGIAAAVSTAINGTTASVLREGDEEYDIVVKYDKDYRSSIKDILDIRVTGMDDVQVPLRDVASIETAGGLGSIKHIDGSRSVKISGEVSGKSSTEVMTAVEKLLREEIQLPPGYFFHFTGENEMQNEMAEYLKKAFGIGILLIIMILITQFNSVSRPLIIIGSVVLSLNGVLLGLVITQTKFSIMMTGMGIISLAGVVVNNAIVLIDYIDRMRAEGMGVKDALIRAGIVRFRPVMLTAITTVLGMIPMAIGVSIDFKRFALDVGSENALWWGPMAQAVIFGLMFATILTLVLVPVMYYIQEIYMTRLFKRFTRKKSVVCIIGTILLVGALVLTGAAVQAGTMAEETGYQPMPHRSLDVFSEDEIPPDNTLEMITLDTAMEMALRNNPSIKTMQERIHQASQQINRAWAILLPNIDANASWTRNDQEISLSMPGPDGSMISSVMQEKNASHYGVNASITVFNARAYPLVKYAYLYADQAGLQTSQTTNDLLVAVVAAYYEVEAAKRAVGVARATVRNAEEFQRLSQGMKKVGQATRIDLLRAESQFLDAQNMLANARDAVDLAKTGLAALINQVGNFDIARPEVFEPVSTQLDSLLVMARDQRRDLQAARLNVKMADRLRQDVLTQWIPSVNLNYGWQWNSSTGFGGDNDSWNVELAASWSILQGGARRAEYKIQQSELRIAENDLKQMELDIHKEIENNLLNLKTSARSLELIWQQHELVEETHRLVRRQYEVGMATSLDLQNVAEELAQIRQRLVIESLNNASAALLLNKSAGVYLK